MWSSGFVSLTRYACLDFRVRRLTALLFQGPAWSLLAVRSTDFEPDSESRQFAGYVFQSKFDACGRSKTIHTDAWFPAHRPTLSTSGLDDLIRLKDSVWFSKRNLPHFELFRINLMLICDVLAAPAREIQPHHPDAITGRWYWGWGTQANRSSGVVCNERCNKRAFMKNPGTWDLHIYLTFQGNSCFFLFWESPGKTVFDTCNESLEVRRLEARLLSGARSGRFYGVGKLSQTWVAPPMWICPTGQGMVDDGRWHFWRSSCS